MNLYLDRLTLKVTGLTQSDGRHLAGLVAQRLAAADAPAISGVPGPFRVSLATRQGENLESMARRIVSEVLSSIGGLP